MHVQRSRLTLPAWLAARCRELEAAASARDSHIVALELRLQVRTQDFAPAAVAAAGVPLRLCLLQASVSGAAPT